MKHEALFSSKDKSRKLKCRLLQFLFCALRVNIQPVAVTRSSNYKQTNSTCIHRPREEED